MTTASLPLVREEAKREQVEGKKFYRSMRFANRRDIDEKSRTVEVAFSSETPYARWFGIEILGHGKKEVRLDWLKGGTAALLDQHNDTRQIGVIESARIDADGVGRCTVRFSKSAAADEIFQDVIDGIRSNISVGYRVHKVKLVESSEETDTYRVIDWEPLEVSFVSVPADQSVGVGRSGDGDMPEKQTKERDMAEKEVKGQQEETTPKIDVEKLQAEARRAELERIREITAIGAAHGMKESAEDFIAGGKSVDDYRSFVLDELAKRGVKPVETPSSEIGMSDAEVRQFSFQRAIYALANPGNRKAQEAAAFEYEASAAVGEKMGRSAKGIMVPMDVMSRAGQLKDPASAGGHLVDTTLMTGSFIDLLRNKMLLTKMGTTLLTGLIGDIAVPKQLGGTACYWVDEGGAPDESAATFGQVAMTPKTVGARTEISRKLLLQSSLDIEGFIRNDLATTVALGIDMAGINGSGSGSEPEGILNVTGIGSVSLGANGGTLSWEKVVELWSSVALENADVGNTGFITNSLVCGQLLVTEKSASTGKFLVDGFPNPEGFVTLAGARCGISNQVPHDLKKGTGTKLSALLFGNFADLMIGMWGTLDLTIDPYSKAESGTIRVIALQDVDVAVKRAQSFAAIADVKA